MVKKYKIRITDNAQNDLEHIFFYIAADSINNAKKIILELEKRVYTLDTFSGRFAYIPENIYFEANYRHLIYKKYRVIYKIKSNSVYILRVIHGSKLLDL